MFSVATKCHLRFCSCVLSVGSTSHLTDTQWMHSDQMCICLHCVWRECHWQVPDCVCQKIDAHLIWQTQQILFFPAGNNLEIGCRIAVISAASVTAAAAGFASNATSSTVVAIIINDTAGAPAMTALATAFNHCSTEGRDLSFNLWTSLIFHSALTSQPHAASAINKSRSVFVSVSQNMGFVLLKLDWHRRESDDLFSHNIARMHPRHMMMSLKVVTQLLMISQMMCTASEDTCRFWWKEILPWQFWLSHDVFCRCKIHAPVASLLSLMHCTPDKLSLTRIGLKCFEWNSFDQSCFQLLLQSEGLKTTRTRCSIFWKIHLHSAKINTLILLQLTWTHCHVQSALFAHTCCSWRTLLLVALTRCQQKWQSCKRPWSCMHHCQSAVIQWLVVCQPLLTLHPFEPIVPQWTWTWHACSCKLQHRWTTTACEKKSALIEKRCNLYCWMVHSTSTPKEHSVRKQI